MFGPPCPTVVSTTEFVFAVLIGTLSVAVFHRVQGPPVAGTW